MHQNLYHIEMQFENSTEQKGKEVILKGVKTISTFLNNIKRLNKKKALKRYAKAYFPNDIRQ